MKKLDLFCAKYEKIYIYGAGKYGRILCLYLEDQDVNIGGFIVSGKVNNKKVLGYNIYSIDIVSEVNLQKCGIIVALNVSIASEVIGKLRDRKFDNLFIFSDEKELDFISNKITFSKNHIIPQNINVLLWHRVGYIGTDTRNLSIELSLFKDQLKYLKDRYEIIRSDDDWKMTDKPSIILTFDDGYFDFHNVVLPILNEYEIPATVFITTGNIDTDNELWGDRLESLIFNEFGNVGFVFKDIFYDISDEENRYSTLFKLRNILKNTTNDDRSRMLSELYESAKIIAKNRKSHRIMSSKEILECSRSPYVTIGAHTVSHCSLAFENHEVQYKEMSESKTVLENIIQKPVEVFAYPYGTLEDFSTDTIKVAMDVGFKRIFSACPGVIKNNDLNDYNGRFPRNSIATCKDINSSVRKLKLLERIYADDYI